MNIAFRNHFPALQRQINGEEITYLDGPAGTQVPTAVIQAISDYYSQSNANTHGAFAASKETDQVLDETRRVVATFLGAEGPHTISFGQNMTTLNYSLSRALGRLFRPGDEVLITQLDHEANRGPWLSLREKDIIVREVSLKPDGHLDYDDLARKINDRTRLLAMGLASNIFGTVNDVALARRLTLKAGAWLLLDAVHYAPHFPVDVQKTGCDFLLCSAYKFYGPHVGLLYAKPGLLDRLPTDRLRTADQHAPFSIETGTLNHAAIAGVRAAIEFIAGLASGGSDRSRLEAAMQLIHDHERALAERLFKGLRALPGVSVVGPHFDTTERAPTLAVVVEGKSPVEVCDYLASRNIYAWDGHFYAIRATEATGLWRKGGVTRLGISAYSQDKDVERALEAFKEIAAG